MKKITIAALLVGAIGFSACGANDIPDAPRDKGSAKAMINMPDGFPSVALKCRGTTGVYVSNKYESGAGADVAVLPNDPECGGVSE